jgi:hypothetical protein
MPVGLHRKMWTCGELLVENFFLSTNEKIGTRSIHTPCGQKIPEIPRVQPVFHKKSAYYHCYDLISYSL